jgi:hypothetical protein
VSASHDPVPGAGQPGIYAEDDHFKLILRRPSDACLP